MKSVLRLLEKTAGPLGLMFGTVGVIFDFLAPLGAFALFLSLFLLALTIVTVICARNDGLLLRLKRLSNLLPEFICNEVHELWQPEGVVFWKRGLFQVLALLTALSFSAAVYGANNPKGFLATKIESVADLQLSLGLISSKLDDISAKQEKLIEGVETVNQKLDLVKKETSEDPRKELSNLGISWSQKSFLEVLRMGDAKAINLFLAGGMDPSLKWEAGDYSVVAIVIHWGVPHIANVIEQFEKYGLKIDGKYLTSSHSKVIIGKQENYSLLTIAIEANNLDMIRYLVMSRGFPIKKQYDEAGDLYALAASSLVVKPTTFKLLTELLHDKSAQEEAAHMIEEQMFEIEQCVAKNREICIGSQNLVEIKDKLKIAEGV